MGNIKTPDILIIDDELELSEKALLESDLEHKQAQEALRASEENMHLIIDTSPVGICTVDPLGNFVTTNLAYERMVGYSKEELRGLSFFDLTHPDNRPKNKKLFQDMFFLKKTNFFMEKKYIRKDGAMIEVAVHATGIMDAEGNTIFGTAFVEDITKRKQSEEALRKSEGELLIENKIANIFLTVPDNEMYGEVLNVVLEIMKSPYGTFAYINEDGDRIVPSMTRDIWDECKMPDKGTFFPRETWGDTLWARCIIEKKSFSSNGPFTVPDGHISMFRCLATPIIHQGESIGNLMVGNKPTDYTEPDRVLLEIISDRIAPILYSRLLNEKFENERNQNEKALNKEKEFLKKAHDELELKVEERTRELHNELQERKRTEEALSESEEKYRGIIENANEGIAIIQDGMIKFLNSKPSEISGYSQQELMSKPFIEFVYPDDQSIVMQHHIKRLKGEKISEKYELRLVAKDGNVKWVEDNGVIVGWEGKPATLNLLTDITNRKQVEESLRESEKKYRMIAENMADVITTMDMNLRFTYVSPSIIRLRGFTVEEAFEHTIDQIMTPDSFQLIAKVFEEEFRLEATATADLDRTRILELEEYRKDGSTIWVENTLSFIRDKDQKAIEILVMSRDISERRQAEDALRESEILLKATQRIAKMGGWEYNVQSNVGTYTDMVSELFYGKTISDPKEGIKNYHIDDRMLVSQSFENAIAKNEPYDIEVRFRNAQGDNLWVRTVGKPVVEDGKVVKIIGNLIDITERKKLESQLLQSQKMESIGTLAGGLAHDFNNLLYVAMGNISLAQDDLKYETGTSESLKAAEEACIKAKELTARLITFSKGGDPVKKKIPIGDLLKNTVISALKGFNIKSKIFIPDAIRQVNIDENQIKQVFSNIVVNAREAMDDNEQLTVSCEKIDISENSYLTLSQGEYIKISFEDQGCGISKENFEKIFDPYFSTKDMGLDKGQGLGLTVSYSIVQKHGGLITVESEQDIGSTFSVYLPAISVNEPDFQKSEKKSAAQKPVKQPANGTGKILLMDDEEAIRIFMGQVLNRLGYDAETCTEGKETFEIYKKAMESKEPFDVAILDLTNKIGMGGQETMKRLLEIDPAAKGIIITGYSDDPVVANFKAYGFSGVITKPATRNELSKVINEVLSKEK